MLRNNLQKIRQILFCLISLIIVVQPVIVLADVNAPGGGGNGIQNPLGNNNMIITDLIANVINFLLGLVAVLALLALIIGGVYIILGFTNEEYVKQGKNIIKWAIIGLIVVGAAWAIVRVAVGLLGITV